MKMAILELEYKNIRKITALKLPFTNLCRCLVNLRARTTSTPHLK